MTTFVLKTNEFVAKRQNVSDCVGDVVGVFISNADCNQQLM
jgi:hypothetical protein